MAPPVVEESTPLLLEDGAERCESPQGHSRQTADFDPDDPENPLEWPARFKWGVVALLAFTAFTVTFNCISIVPVSNHIVDDLSGGNGDKSIAVLLVTIWELGEAAGPLLVAPLSEMLGRYPVINTCNMLFITATALAAVSQSTALFIVSRALTGMAVSSNVLNPAIVGDIFPPEQRGKAMSLMMLAPLVGGSVGPAAGGAIAQTLGWRFVLWVSVSLAGVGGLLLVTCFRETYKVPILRRRAARLGKDIGQVSVASAVGKERDPEKGSVGLRTSIMRPAVVLFSSGVLAALSLYGAVVFSYFYVVAVTLPNMLEDIYGLSPAATGSAFLANAIGSLIGIGVCNLSLDKIYIKLRAANDGVGQPEYRLPMSIVGAFTLPPAVALYGWCAEHHLPLAVLLLSVVWIRLSLMLAFLPVMSYVVDACGLYSASALTGVIVTRCLAGAFLPLLTTQMIEDLGNGWGFTVFGAISLIFALIPVMILRYGPQWRQHCKYSWSA